MRNARGRTIGGLVASETVAKAAQIAAHAMYLASSNPGPKCPAHWKSRPHANAPPICGRKTVGSHESLGHFDCGTRRSSKKRL
jgi:hypothetical protein